MDDAELKAFQEVYELQKKLHPLAYVLMMPALTRAARQCGYALAWHGSLTRDFDIIAVPWTEDAVSAEELVAAVIEAADLLVDTTQTPTVKPHGRRTWSLLCKEGHLYLDFSVMPRLV